MTNNKSQEPWTQQKGEQSNSFYLFTVYRDLGPFRTLEKVIPQVQQEATKNHKNGVPAMAGLLTLSSRWKWVNRCKAWDENLDEIGRTEQELAVKEMTKRHASTSKDLQDRITDIVDDKEYEGLSPTQKAWALNSATHSYAKLAMLERLSRGQSTEGNEGNSKGLREFARTIEDSIEKAKKEE